MTWIPIIACVIFVAGLITSVLMLRRWFAEVAETSNESENGASWMPGIPHNSNPTVGIDLSQGQQGDCLSGHDASYHHHHHHHDSGGHHGCHDSGSFDAGGHGGHH